MGKEGGSGEFRVDDIWILMPVVDAYPHLFRTLISYIQKKEEEREGEGGKEGKTYLPKCTQPSQNTASNPSRIFPLRRRKYLDPHILNS